MDIELDNNEDDPEDIMVKHKYNWSDTLYETTLQEIVSETISDYHDDLYEYDITEIIF